MRCQLLGYLSAVFLGFSFIAMGAPAWAAENASHWLLVGEHYHTTTDVDYSKDPNEHLPIDSYDPAGIIQLLDRGEKAGLDAMIVTEHNSVATCFDPIFRDRSNRVALICGEEWTTHKSLHIGIFNPPIASPAEGYLPSETREVMPLAQAESEARKLVQDVHRAARAREQRSLVVVNHPGFKMYRPSDSLGADAVEAIVPDYEAPSRGRFWWLTQLAAGHRMVALGGSDYHACKGWSCIKRGDFFRTFFDEPLNLVFAPSSQPADVLEAIARGRVVAISSSKYKDVRIETWVDGRDGQGRYAMGDVIAGVQAGEAVRMGVRIAHAEGLYAVVYGIGAAVPGPESGALRRLPFRVVRDKLLETGDFAAVVETTKAGVFDALHVELFEPDDWGGHSDGLPVAISNPIYF